MTNESDLVPLHMHNLLTAGPAPWTDTRVPSEVWHVARAVYGTSTEDDEKRVYRTLQAALWKLAAPQPEAQPQWQPIGGAPQDGRTLLLGYFNAAGKWRTVRGQWMSADYIADNWEDPDSGEPGWYETAVEADDIPNCWPIRPTHWMPLPAAPSAQAEPAKCPHTGQCHPGFCPCSDVKRTEQGDPK